MLKVEEIKQELLNSLFASNVVLRIRLKNKEKYDDFTKEEIDQVKGIVENKVAVLGFDIYKYSTYSDEKQPFIPHLFDRIYEESWHLIVQNFDFLFQHYHSGHSNPSAELHHEKYFINTGDGGFQLFQTPLHAVVFVIVFETILSLYNAGIFMPKLHAKIDNVTIRYALTYDNVYEYKSNFYGASIINNSRIMGRDQLNRFLIDDNSYRWFLQSIIGVENLMSMRLSEIAEIEEFSSYDMSKLNSKNNALIHNDTKAETREGIKSVDIQKIGTIQSKQTILEIYNLHLQSVIHYGNIFDESKEFTISVGNLNTEGLTEKT